MRVLGDNPDLRHGDTVASTGSRHPNVVRGVLRGGHPDPVWRASAHATLDEPKIQIVLIHRTG